MKRYEIVWNDSAGEDEYTLGYRFNKEMLFHEEINIALRYFSDKEFKEIAEECNGYEELNSECGNYYWFKSEKDCLCAFNSIEKERNKNKKWC